MNRIEDIVEKIGTLPPLPDTTVRLMAVVRDPHSSIGDIVAVIKYDEVATSEILRICNSAYFGLNRRINSLSEATICLGTAKLLQLVMAVHSSSLLGKEQNGYGMAPGLLWQHSVGVAIGSEILGRRLALPNKNLLFTMGLLHDIGKVVLNEYVAVEYTEIARLVDDEGYAFNEAERMVLGYDHCEVGSFLAEKWQLPIEIIECIRWHHEPAEVSSANTLIDLVYLANVLGMMLGIGGGNDGLCYRSDEEILVRHNLTGGDMEMIGAEVVDEVRRVKEMFVGKEEA